MIWALCLALPCCPASYILHPHTRGCIAAWPRLTTLLSKLSRQPRPQGPTVPAALQRAPLNACPCSCTHPMRISQAHFPCGCACMDQVRFEVPLMLLHDAHIFSWGLHAHLACIKIEAWLVRDGVAIASLVCARRSNSRHASHLHSPHRIPYTCAHCLLHPCARGGSKLSTRRRLAPLHACFCCPMILLHGASRTLPHQWTLSAPVERPARLPGPTLLTI